MSIIVTSYEHPDLDGTACAVAYAEFLQKQGHDVTPVVFGVLHKETSFVVQTFHISPPANGETLLTKDNQVILVDASDVTGISKKILPGQVIEIVDHRKITYVDKFPNAKSQIELVGSAATLIAEKFMEQHVSISKDAAVLLYSAIVSNTINFQANVTTDRDKHAAEWLREQVTLPDNYIHEMFAFKSRLNGSVKDALLHDFGFFTFANKKVGIFQLEIINVEAFIKKNLSEIQTVMTDTQKSYAMNFVFLTVVDVEKATNTFVVRDMQTQDLLEKTLQITFEKSIAKRNGILMRKTITPLLKQALEG